MPLTIQREAITHELFDEFMPVLQANHGETGMLAGEVLDPDRGRYIVLDQAGYTRCFTARDRSILVGYAVMMISPSLHSKSSVYAIQDAMFLLPEYRTGMAGVRLIRFSDEQLKAEGVQAVIRQAALKRDVSRVFQRLGYTHTHNCFARRL